MEIKEINVLVNGLGKMGTKNVERFLQEDDISVLAVADPKPSEEGKKLLVPFDVAYADSFEGLNLKLFGGLAKTDKLFTVDFSNPDACRKACLLSAENGINIVSGTTPIPESYETEIRNAITRERVKGVRQSNFSVGVNKFFKEMKTVAAHIDPNESIAIYEEHRLEKGKTSGTAKDIAKVLCMAADRPGYILLKEGQAFNGKGGGIAMPEDLTNYIQDSAIRFANEEGTHWVKVGDERDYRVYSVKSTRDSYAEGVVRTLRFLADLDEAGKRSYGTYSYSEDVLGL